MDLLKIPPAASSLWIRLLAYLLIGTSLFLLGVIWGASAAGQRELDRANQRAEQTAKLAQATVRVMWKTEIKYRDRIRTVYQKGETIEKQVPVYVTPVDDRHCSINVGFVRSFNAAWSNEPAGPGAESDREPAGVPLSAVAEVDAHNATACHAWREQALGLREAYGKLKATIEGEGDQ